VARATGYRGGRAGMAINDRMMTIIPLQYY